MSKSAKLYLVTAFCLIGFPLILSFWSLASALLAILMLGIGAYAVVACFLLASFWHLSHYGTWPIEFEEDPKHPRRYPPEVDPMEGAASRGLPDVGERAENEVPYRLSDALRGWLHRHSWDA